MNLRVSRANRSLNGSSSGLAGLAFDAPVARAGVMDAVTDRLRDEILSGRLLVGSALPSERELALSLGVNRLTLRAALARLETLGLIVTRHGARTTVASWRERAGLEALTALIGSSIAPENPAWRELLTSMMEIRRILASEAVALAAERHDEFDLEAMTVAADAQKARVDDPIAFAKGDIVFQRAVVRAAQNVGLELLLNSFARFPEEQPRLVAALYENPRLSVDFYPLIMDLVRARDPDAARTLVRTTLDQVDRVWREHNFPVRALNKSVKPAKPLIAETPKKQAPKQQKPKTIAKTKTQAKPNTKPKTQLARSAK
jgi:GntR family transcriptional repressor for pyruvate dehydrogenase complex